ncbi:PQQ-binding-like beta-propeller repeat protein [Embleya sp. NBC_00896]|uniref:protein kinase domain-containing protein n=1 Tax=Embleya sp. NBC_00896 TaxID=2975961 RepID=UPI002F90D5DA|nr:PQQ-binding-like beta-propeller repeat protein [Embleya sp. NBC_00896]
MVRVLADRYELVSFVGRGGMGEVWAGRDRVIGRRVAVKLLPDHREDSSAELFFREARTAGGLNHRGVVTVHDMGQDPGEGTLFLVMEFVDGRDLAAVLRRDGPPPVPVAVDWAARTADALAAAHAAGVVHRDLKPANLMLTPGGEVKVLDFGIARFLESTGKSSTVMGTLAYMPPERFDEQPGDARSDLYSFGCVLHELLTGATPFQATGAVSTMTAHLHKAPLPPSETRPGIPAALDDLVMRLLAKAPGDRPASATEVRDALRALNTPDSPGAGAAAGPEHSAPADRPTPRTPAGPAGEAGPGASEAPVHAVPTRPAAPPRPPYEPVGGSRTKPLPPNRRRVLRLGLGAAGAAAVGTAVTVALVRRGDSADANAATGGHSPGTAPPGTAPPGTGGPPTPPRQQTTRPTTPVWSFPGTYPSPPVVAGGVLYVTANRSLVALDPLTGRTRWETPLETEAGTPAVGGGMVYCGGEDNALHALDLDGKPKWTFPTGDRVRTVPAVIDGLVVFGSLDNKVYALDASTGTKKWVFPTGDSIFCSPTVHDGTVYIGSHDRNMYALNATNGTKKWAFTAGLGFPGPGTSLMAGTLYATSNDENVYALDAATGAKKWAVSLADTRTDGLVYRVSTPVAGPGMVYVGGADNFVHALDAATGAEKWTFGTFDVGVPTPTVANGLVYVGCQDKHVYAFDALSGSKRWSFKSEESLEATPTVAGTLVYVAGEKNLYAFDAAGGGAVG